MTYGQFMDTVYIPAYETEVEESTFYVRKRTLESMRDRFSNIELRSLAVEDVQRYRTWLLLFQKSVPSQMKILLKKKKNDQFQFIGGMKVGEPSVDGRGSAPPELAEQQARAGSEAAPATPPL